MKRLLFISSVFLILGLAIFSTAQDPIKTTIARYKCVGCGDCVRTCPVQAITIEKGKAIVDPEKCVACKLCVKTCSYGAPR